LASQLALPLSIPQTFARDSFIVAACNAQAFAFIESWPCSPVSVAAIYGPAGCGKTHLASIWQADSGAHLIAAAELDRAIDAKGPWIVEDVDAAPPGLARDSVIFRLMEAATPARPLLLTGKEPPSLWATAMPDLASRFAAIVSFPLWTPSDELLAGLTRKLLDDRQIPASDAVIAQIIRGWERSPAAIRNFVAKADAKALAESRSLTLALVRELLAAEGEGLS